MKRRDRQINARAQSLVALAASHFPQEFDVAGKANMWPVTAAGFVSRMTGTMKAILRMHPEGREAEAGAAVRSLLEQAIYLAWLGADPSPERIEEWIKADLRSRLNADNDARELDTPILNDEQRREIEKQIEDLPGSRLNLKDLIAEVDAYWTGKLAGMRGDRAIQSFAGFYTFVYRQYSAYTHATYRGLNCVVDDLGPTRRRVRLEGPYDGNGPYGTATAIFGLALLIVASTLGWPDVAEVNAIFEKYP